MIPNWLLRRNRFKNKPRPPAPKRRFAWRDVDWRRHLGKAAMLGLVAGALAALAVALDRPIRTISMEGDFQRVSPGQIESAVAPYLAAGFMSADLDAVERAIEVLPWVDHARVQRRWPDSLHVSIVEQTAAARWGESGLLNTRGEVFLKAAAHVPSELPRLSGPPGTESQVAKQYLAAEARMLEAGMRIAALRLDERGAWEMDLDSGVTVRLGRREVDARLDRFIRAAAQVVAHRASEVVYVDMRYSNGFAIGWRTAATPSSPSDIRPEEING
jgi:cell division protein FtsQ